MSIALALHKIEKSFGGVKALEGASLIVERGTVHGLVGQNGAGKSTLIKVLAGVHAPDAGTILIDGVTHSHLSPHEVERLGIHFIHQDRLLPPTLTVAEALFLGQEPRWTGLPFVNRGRLNRDARDILRRTFAIEIAPSALIRELSTAEQQIVQITRALMNAPKILVFDEPTTALVRREADLLFAAIKRLRADGLTVLYISHYLSEISDLCDKVTVLRNGRDVGTVDPRHTTTGEIVKLMIDRRIDDLFPERSPKPGAPLIEIEHLSVVGSFSDVSFSLRRGEIVGVTGLVGSGPKALMRSLFGLTPPSAGTITLNGKRVRPRTPITAVNHGIGLLPEDRRAQGVSLDLSVRENMTLASLDLFARLGWLRPALERAGVADFIARLGIRTLSTETPVRSLSGGNQQKVSLAKWLTRGSDVILLDEPSVGVDVGAKVDIYREIGSLADQGKVVLVASSDLIELLGLTDRILIFYRGQIVAVLKTRETDQDTVLEWVTTGQSIGARYVAA
jgi:ribose transport system ATP-binding protein